MMKAYFRHLLICGLFLMAKHALAQGDLAIYDTFQRYSPAVFSVSVEIPKEFIMQRYEENIDELKGYQDYLVQQITDRSQGNSDFRQFDTLFAHLERKLDTWKERLLSNNRVRGAAFAVDPHHLVTLSSVVKSATLGGEIVVMDDHQNALKAILQGIDEMTGVAVLRIADATFNRYVELNSDFNQLPEASYVMTIQRPYDLPATPVSGMIGGYYRQLKLFELERYIQTDFPLYPGNEGSPVFSPSGQLVGMLAAEFHKEDFPSVTFVIPGDMIADSANEIINHGRMVRGEIPGVSMNFHATGLRIEEVLPSSPYSAQLQEGDVIIGMGDAYATDLLSLYYQIKNAKPNQNVTLFIQRGDSQFQIQLRTTIRQ